MLRIVAGAIIDDQPLEIAIGLRDQTFVDARKRPRTIVRGRKNGEGISIAHIAFSRHCSCHRARSAAGAGCWVPLTVPAKRCSLKESETASIDRQTPMIRATG